MVPDKFNMVDMGGIDLIMMQGEEVPGLYNRLVESIAQCRYQCLYNWLFDGVIIPPTYVEMEVNENDEVAINEGVVVTPDDVIRIYSIQPPAPEPVINPISITENGIYNAPEGVDGYSPVTVNITGDNVVYAVKDVNLDAILDGIGGTSLETGGGYRILTPMCVLTCRYPNVAKFYIQRNSSYFSNKACLRTTGGNLTSISCPNKISAGKYSKLVIEYIIVSRGSSAGYVMGCGRALTYDNYAFNMNVKNINLHNTTDPIGSVLTKELDISDVAEDFYFGMYQWGYELYIRNFYVTK